MSSLPHLAFGFEWLDSDNGCGRSWNGAGILAGMVV